MTNVPPSQPLNGIPRSTIHELRTPLTSIRGYAQLLQRGVRTPEQAQRAYDTIFRESERLANMLDQLSRVAEVTTDPSDVTPTRFDLGRLAEQIVQQAGARWPNHPLRCRAVPGLQVVADPRRAEELLKILLDNAATYSEPGSPIEVRVDRSEQQACVSVVDQGIGIPGDELESIFLCFKRASNVGQAGGHGSRGLGIGLFIAQAITGQLGGRLWAESGSGAGSTFTLSLPVSS
jgi:two-component system, OmpR family, phosphate regulon sensor histidine kinase PhoR